MGFLVRRATSAGKTLKALPVLSSAVILCLRKDSVLTFRNSSDHRSLGTELFIWTARARFGMGTLSSAAQQQQHVSCWTFGSWWSSLGWQVQMVKLQVSEGERSYGSMGPPGHNTGTLRHSWSANLYWTLQWARHLLRAVYPVVKKGMHLTAHWAGCLWIQAITEHGYATCFICLP